jgi:hypothetical protein
MNVQERVNNNLSGLFRVTSSKVKSEVENKKETGKKELNYFEREMARYQSDPANGKVIQARARGLHNPSNFLKSACDSKDPDHNRNFNLFKSGYDLDARRVENAYIAKAMTEMGASEYEFQDKPYEDRVIKKFKPSVISDVTQEHMLNLFKEACQAKWNAKGYKNDSSEIPALASRFGLVANSQSAELKNIELKP